MANQMRSQQVIKEAEFWLRVKAFFTGGRIAGTAVAGNQVLRSGARAALTINWGSINWDQLGSIAAGAVRGGREAMKQKEDPYITTINVDINNQEMTFEWSEKGDQDKQPTGPFLRACLGIFYGFS